MIIILGQRELGLLMGLGCGELGREDLQLGT
jgi:hypothetical protein